MKSPPAPALHPAWLVPGTQVGCWRVVNWAGQGGHGAVYQAVRVGQEQAESVALKLALQPDDARLAREVAVLSRVEHPSVPRLLDSGEWHSAVGTRHQFLVMQWVQGVQLYEWARQHCPSSEQVLRRLAQMARALQALHAQGALHRDVKGGNILVRHSDSRAFLTDFGSSTYAGATTLTSPAFVPGTLVYRSPEAALIELRSLSDPQVRYTARPAEDLYALGVTACQLVTGEYPGLGEVSQDKRGNWQVESVVLPPAQLDDTRVPAPLRELILRMLSVRPKARGTAAELAERLEQAAESLVPGSAVPRGSHKTFKLRSHVRDGRLGLATAAAGLALATWLWWEIPRQSVESPFLARREVAKAERADAGTAGIGDAVSATPEGNAPRSSVPDAMTEDTPPEPVPGQIRPDAKGRCPGKRQVALNGACWLKAGWDSEECALTGGQMFQGSCYAPCIKPVHPPTSHPQ